MYPENNPLVTGLVVVGLLIGIAAGVIYISAHASCFNAFGLAKGCVIH